MKLKIEMNVSYQDEEKYQHVIGAVRRAAQQMFTVANLLQDGVPPSIMIFSEDFLMGQEAIMLNKEEPNE